jgi:hypothetical protein
MWTGSTPVLALGERAASAGDVVAHRAVDAEEFGTVGRIAVCLKQ